MISAVPTLKQLESWMADTESERLEFKAAKEQFDSDKLTRYCVALANEGGGHLVLGVSDKHPRQVVGTLAFRDLAALKRTQAQRIGLRIDAAELSHSNGRVLIVSVPPRPIGTPVHYRGSYWMRRGEDLVPMGPEVLKSVFDEAQPDYSAEICEAATADDLDPSAVERLRTLWYNATGNDALVSLDQAQILEDAELTIDGAVTYAALILLGSHKALGRHLAQAETIFEYRSSDGSVSYQQRQEFRKGFLLYLDQLWDLIASRNEVHLYQDGLFRREIATLNEVVVREALLNAMAHRDYRHGGSIFVRQYPKRLQIVSPGGFPPGITAENLLWRQSPRNRRVAEVMAKCDLVERSGQGANLMFEASIQESKPLPDFTDSDDHQVCLLLDGKVQDERFLRFLERVGQETLSSFTTNDFLLVHAIHDELEIDERLRAEIPRLMELGVIESKGRGRGTRYLLSERYYSFVGGRGTYTRRKGLDRETNKALVLAHIKRNEAKGSPLRDLQEVLPTQSSKQVQRLLYELRDEGAVHSLGRTRGARWYPGAINDDASEQ